MVASVLFLSGQSAEDFPSHPSLIFGRDSLYSLEYIDTSRIGLYVSSSSFQECNTKSGFSSIPSSSYSNQYRPTIDRIVENAILS